MQLEGEHTSPARGVWRLAKHIVALTLSSPFRVLKSMVEIPAETARTARETRALPFSTAWLRLRRTSDIPEEKFVAKQVVTRPLAFLGSFETAWAADFSFGGLATTSDGFSNRVAQIEVSGQTLAVLASERKYGFCVSNIHFVFHFTRLGEAVRTKISEIGFQRFERGKFFGETGRGIDPLGFAQAVFRPGIVFLRRFHGIRSSADEERTLTERPQKEGQSQAHHSLHREVAQACSLCWRGRGAHLDTVLELVR
jgi:hypothetical protein